MMKGSDSPFLRSRITVNSDRLGHQRLAALHGGES